MKLSIIIPVFNEEKTVLELLAKVQSVVLPFEKEIIVIDDGSTDNTSTLLKNMLGIKILIHEENSGKGTAIRTGIQASTGDILLIQDADLEYDPDDYMKIVAPILHNTADVVFGSRFLDKKNRAFFFHTYWANRFLSFLARLLSPLPITDMETCYKAFRTNIIRSIRLTEKRFGIEPEITMKISFVPDLRYAEVPISYSGRSIQQGKKIRWHDGAYAIWCLIKYRFGVIFSPPPGR